MAQPSRLSSLTLAPPSSSARSSLWTLRTGLTLSGRMQPLRLYVTRRSRAIQQSGLNSGFLSFGGGGIKLRTAATKRPFSLRKCFKKVSTSSVLLRWHSIAKLTHSWQSGRRPDLAQLAGAGPQTAGLLDVSVRRHAFFHQARLSVVGLM